MRLFLTFVAVVACAMSCGFSVLAADEKPAPAQSPFNGSSSAAHKAETVWASPKGTFKIETVETHAENRTADPYPYEQQYVVSTADPKVRESLGDSRQDQPARYFISPDERWIFATIHFGNRMGGGELYKHGEGLKFTPVESKSFAELAWRFFAKQERLKPDDVLDLGFPEASGILDFMGWSPDSARLLVGLRLTATKLGGKREPGVNEWYVYFNTKAGKFELTNYLTRLNKGAWDRYANSLGFSGLVPQVMAEPLGELPPEAESKKRYEAAKGRVKEYEEQLNFSRGAQGGLMDTREIGAKFYAESNPKSNAERRYWQYMADSTEARAAEMEKDLKPRGSNE